MDVCLHIHVCVDKCSRLVWIFISINFKRKIELNVVLKNVITPQGDGDCRNIKNCDWPAWAACVFLHKFLMLVETVDGEDNT